MSADEPKRAYRYLVVDHGGSGTKAIGDSPHILEWSFMGAEYTWTICNTGSLEVKGWISGEFVDCGYVIGGQYEPDGDDEL